MRNRRFQQSAILIGLVLAAGLLAACGSGGKKKFAYVERPVETLYAEAVNRLERKRYEESVAYFEEVERQHPYSSWARRAMLMKAFARYQNNDYDEAVEALDQFIALHPGNKDAPYAYYLKAMCFYEQISDVGRDQEKTENAVLALTDVLRRYPNSEYARDARLKLDLTQDHLAGKEMYIGRYYLRDNKHIAAINRFKYVVENYQTTTHAQEALYRLAEAYLQLGIVDEARAAAAVLGYNYPGSDWYADAYRIFERRDLLDPTLTRVARKGGTGETVNSGTGEGVAETASASTAAAQQSPPVFQPAKSAIAPPETDEFDVAPAPPEPVAAPPPEESTPTQTEK